MNIETLIAPVLKKVCSYCVYKNSGFEVSQDLLLSEIRSELNAVSQRSTLTPMLQQQYQAIEKPLVFFIDYIIKEGNFSYSRSYRELARNFNELSGDDKFFDLLKDAVDQSNDKEVIRVFYILMGLGFDGYYKRHRSEMVDVMQNTISHCNQGIDFNINKITPDINLNNEQQAKAQSWYQRPRYWLISSVALLICCFMINLASLSVHVSDFTQTIDRAVTQSLSFGTADNTNNEPVTRRADIQDEDLNRVEDAEQNFSQEFYDAVEADQAQGVGAQNE